MNPERWERAQAIFNSAIELPDASERKDYVRAKCGPDAELETFVLALLREDETPSVLDQKMGDVASAILGDVPLLPQSEFGPYRISGLLGEGGMGVVYLAERDDLRSKAAVKILRDSSLSPARRARFATEQRTLASLNHPSIARLFDAGTLPDGTPWIVMEYVEGIPLNEFCRAHDLSIADTLLLFRVVCEAVLHAHGHAVIHRDLKPSNILVTRDGSVKLLDFGISKQIDTLEDPTNQTRTDLRLMTPAYAAPEQLTGGRIGVHTDVYSLGVVLYELLAGQLPFDLSRSTPSEAEAMIVHRDTERPSIIAQRRKLLRNVSRAEWNDLDVVCLTAMHKDIDRRYRSVEALIRDVDHYLRGEPLEARPDSVRYNVSKFVRRNSRAVFAVSTTVAVLIAIVAFYTFRVTTARNAALAEAQRTQRIQGFMLSLFDGGASSAGPAESLRVVTLVDRGAREARSLTAEPAVRAELYATLGGIYRTLGNLNRADTLLNASLTERRALFGSEHRDVATSMVELGLLRSDQARFDEAEKLVRSGLELDRRILPPNHPATARATAALGRVLEDRGAYPEAITTLEQAARMESSGGNATPELDEILSELANTHFYLGHFATSDSINQHVLAMSRKLYGPNHPHVANDLINLGAIQFELGHYKEAEQFYRQALSINQAWYGKDNAETASNLTLLGRTLIREDRYDEAMTTLQEALKTQERVYGKVHPRVASALNEIGSVALQRKKLDEAESAFRRMIDIYHSVYGDKHFLLATAVSNLATVYMARKDYVRAEPLYREAVQRFTDTQGPNHVNTGIALIKLGRSLVKQKRYGEAEGQILAGYSILTKQIDPATSFLAAARTDLIIVYDSTNQPAKAAKYRAELAAVEKDTKS
jgi:serine/threonine-protein kinase